MESGQYGAAHLIGWLIGTILLIIPAWRIMGKAGYPAALSLLNFVPILGSLFILIVLAFTDWPALKHRTATAIASTFE
jgi:hypothetical protein